MSAFCPISPPRGSSPAELLSSRDSSSSVNLIPSCQLPCLKYWLFRGRCIPITPAHENLRVAVISFLMVSGDVTTLPWLLKVIGEVEFFPYRGFSYERTLVCFYIIAPAFKKKQNAAVLTDQPFRLQPCFCHMTVSLTEAFLSFLFCHATCFHSFQFNN